MALVTVLIVLGLVGRLAYLQFWRGPELADSSVGNYLREDRLPAERGTIYDRNMNPMAKHVRTFNLAIVPSDVEDMEGLISQLREILPEDGQLWSNEQWYALEEKLQERVGRDRRTPMIVHGHLTRTQVAQILSLGARHRGVRVVENYQREYPDGELAPHILGYLGKLRADELQGQSRYDANSMVGRFGLERRMEDVLSGEDGFRRYAVNARGLPAKKDWILHAMKGIETERKPIRGRDLVLSIDVRLQKIITKAMAPHKSGAVVVLDVWTGAILGIVSKPTFNPNSWSGRLSRKEKQSIDENERKPMIDKSIKAYFPGSVYKVVTALAGLIEGEIQPDTLIESPGRYEFGGRNFHCHKRSGHGRINLGRALSASADVYFYKLGQTMGIDLLAEYAHLLGFGHPPGIEINGEQAGIVPTKAHHEKVTQGGYQHGLSLSTAVGQGDVRSSPLQVALAYAALANGGKVLKPYVVQYTQTPDGEILSDTPTEVVRDLSEYAEFLGHINQGLLEAVHDEKYGTGTLAAVEYGTIAGKTGTAQVRKLRRGRYRNDMTNFHNEDHAWFAAFAPFDEPRISIAVFLEHGGSGGKHAAPVARQIIAEYHRTIAPIFPSQAAGPSSTSGRTN